MRTRDGPQNRAGGDAEAQCGVGLVRRVWAAPAAGHLDHDELVRRVIVEVVVVVRWVGRRCGGGGGVIAV